ncbi:MAG: sensor histidine kinase [Eubacterium sp.]|nr:sensor histidine kinase [Eubacterium sp.]
MKKVRQWVRKLSVKKKLILYGYLFITPILAGVCVILLFQNYDKELQEKLETDIRSVNTLADSINLLKADMENFSTYLCINSQVRELLTEENPAQKNQNARLWYDEAPMQMIQEMMALKGDVQTMAIYPENGIQPYLRCMDGSSYVADLKKIRRSDTYRETLESDNGMIWKSIPKGAGETYQTNRKEKIGLYRKIYDFRKRKVVGFIVVGANQKPYTDLCESGINKNQESVIVLDRNSGELLRVGKLNRKVEKYLTGKGFISENYRTRETHFTYDNYEIICNQIDKDASIVCKVVPRYSMQMQMLDVANMPIALLLGMLVGLLPVLMIISKLVTTPLYHLSVAIQKFSKGDFEQQIEVTTEDELGEVTRCFNKMVLDIKELINENYVIHLKERESELNALQAQINPHFLYNTLDSLYWQATAVDQEDLAESIMALSDLFKLVLNRGNSQVTVAHEFELISKYLQIQKMRFAKRLNYEVLMDPKIEKVFIPKLIIQPFVENAVVHGLENISEPCTLTVLGKRDDEWIHFEIVDTGIGMTSEQIQAIWQEEKDSYKNQRIGRYAIKNIKERLTLQYGENFRLTIDSEVGKGTKVVLRIPWNKEGVNEIISSR